MKRRTAYNPKRRIADSDAWPADRRKAYAERVRYTGNPEHKSKPGDFGLDRRRTPGRARRCVIRFANSQRLKLNSIFASESGGVWLAFKSEVAGRKMCGQF